MTLQVEPPTMAGVAGKAPYVKSSVSGSSSTRPHTGVKSIPYEDTVREALCFGWIDSLIKRLDDNRYALKVTPRQPTSKWSDINRNRWLELKAAGLLHVGRSRSGTHEPYLRATTGSPDLPVYIAKALKANSKACGVLSGAGTHLPTSLRRLDSYG